MSDLVGNSNCWFSHVKAHNFTDSRNVLKLLKLTGSHTMDYMYRVKKKTTNKQKTQDELLLKTFSKLSFQSSIIRLVQRNC